MDDLFKRLSSLGFNAGIPDSFELAPRKKSADLGMLGEWQKVNQNEILTATRFLPFPIRYGEVTIEEKPDFRLLADLQNHPTISMADSSQFLFLDTETSSLGLGAGVFIFLIGLCWFEDEGLRTCQVFLDDFSKEIDFLLYIDAIIRDYSVIVTYNGKSFDIPVLRSRFILNQIPNQVHNKAHIDLLHLSRRLFQNDSGSKKLADIEKHILRFLRSDEDIPGWMVPQVYFDYLENGEIESLGHVFYHNKTDVISLAALSDYICSHSLKRNQQPATQPERLIAIAEILKRNRHFHLAKEYFEHGIHDNEWGNLDKTWPRGYGYVLKKTGDWQKAVAVWQESALQGDLHACIELAKYYEHREKDLRAAKNWALKSIEYASSSPIVSDRLQDELLHRLERINKKASKLVDE